MCLGQLRSFDVFHLRPIHDHEQGAAQRRAECERPARGSSRSLVCSRVRFSFDSQNVRQHCRLKKVEKNDEMELRLTA
jgi:hypothetical protein